jgi:integrase/recombinase XerD
MTPIDEVIETYMFAVVSGLSEHSVLSYGDKLKVFSDFCAGIGLEGVSPKVFSEFLQEVGKRVNPRTGVQISDKTVSGYAVAVKVFLNWTCSYEDYAGIVRPGTLKAMRLPKVDKKVKPIYDSSEAKKIYEATRLGATKFIIERDRAIISLLLDTGARSTELCTLKIEDVHLDLEDSYIKVLGKGGKEREVGLGKQSRLDLHRYTRNHRRGAKPGECVFRARTGANLNRFSLDQILYRILEVGGVEKKGGAHTFRHTFATAYLEQGGSIYDLRDLMGHSDISITQGYTQNTAQKSARKRSGSVWDKM